MNNEKILYYLGILENGALNYYQTVETIRIASQSIQNYIEQLEQQCKKQKEVISRAVKYIENEMPYLQETDKEYEDVNGNTYFTYKEYDGKELLGILKEVSE